MMPSDYKKSRRNHSIGGKMHGTSLATIGRQLDSGEFGEASVVVAWLLAEAEANYTAWYGMQQNRDFWHGEAERLQNLLDEAELTGTA